jgi:hypothetical protein
MSLRKLLNVTVEVCTPGTPTKNAYGGWTDVLTKVTVPASVQIDSSTEALQFERQTKKRTFAVYLENSVVVPVNARVIVISGEYTGTVLDLTAPKADHAGRSTYWMLRGTEVL